MTNGGEVRIKISTDIKGSPEDLKTVKTGLDDVGKGAEKAGAALASSKPAMDSLGMSAKATTAALRGIPAQFTDIVTSLQGGQSPLTVLMQQGGQLKDMFGGVGAASRALGGYVLGLVNPFTVAAAAAAGLAYAYEKGSEESNTFSRSLILSGNAANTTAGQLMDQARNVAASTGATRGAAAETLNELAASGNVSASVLERVTKSAVEMERVGGAAAADTAKEIIALGNDPAKAILKLDEKYHFLTASIYEQIKALGEQGRETEAASLAQTTYADALDSRIPRMEKSLGTLERAWRGVWGAIKGAGDAALDFGRELSLDEKLKKALSGAAGEYDHSARANIIAPGAQTQVNILSNEIEARDQLLLIQKKSRETEEAKIKWQATADNYLDKEAKKRKEIAAIEREGLAVGAAREEIAKRIAAVEDKYADKKKKADPRLDALFDRSDEMTRIRRQAEDELKAFDSARKKDKSPQERAQAEQIASNYEKQFNTNLERIARQNELIGLSEREARVKQALYKIEDDAQRVREELTRQVKDETALKEKLAEVEGSLAEKKLLVADATRKSYDESRTFEAGWKDAFAKYQDSATNAADTARTAFSGMTGAMESAIKTFVKSGKIDFKSFGDSVINTLIDIQLQSLRTKVLAPMMEGAGSWFSGLAGNIFSGLLGSANGNVFSGSPSLHQYVNTVQTSPKTFAFNTLHGFARGGVFAEAGPEAVMPLARDASGRLGVRTQGDGGAPSMTYAPNVTIDARGADAGVEGRLNAALAKFLAQQDTMVKSIMRGALLRNGTKATF